MKKIKKVGRPPLRPGSHRDARRYIALRQNEMKMLDSVAAESGKSFSTWARDVLLTAASQREGECVAPQANA
jgi:hypothetical protein